MTFSDLNLQDILIENLGKQGYTTPTPIQQQAIPFILQGKDIFGCAQTGTGKTAAFALPLLQLLSAKKINYAATRVLVLAPTRELVQQVSDSFSKYGKGLNLKHTTIIGGVSQHSQVISLRRGADIIVATPGRLLDLLRQGAVKLNNVEYLVLDEADRMLDMGFINDIKAIVAKLPVKRQTIFFSATMPPAIMKLVNSWLHDPAQVSITPISSPKTIIKQYVYYVQKENKRALLKSVLKSNDISHALVFTRTKRGADKIVKELNSNGVKAEAIHGNKSQNNRERALRSFKDRKINILVATDIASRGIDVDKLTHVINFEIPEQAETYVHRIGRTGRAGMSGVAMSFCDRDELPYWKDIKGLVKKDIEVVSAHPFS